MSYINNREIVIEAVRQDGHALQYASDSLRNDREIVLITIRRHSYAILWASEELRNDPWFKRTPLQNFRALAKMALKFKRQDEEYIKWFHPTHYLMHSYFEHYNDDNDDAYIPKPLIGLEKVYKKRKVK